jgi:hypothetical protein
MAVSISARCSVPYSSEGVLPYWNHGEEAMDYFETDALSRQQHAAEAGRRHHSPEETTQFFKAALVVSKLYEGRRKQRAGTVVEVLFDSSLQGNSDGVRSAGKLARQMLFRAGTYHVDVQIEAIPDAARLSIMGQLLNASNPEIVAREALVTLSNGCGNLVHLVTNEFGEFCGEIENSSDLKLVLPNGRGAPITISLRDALV